MRRRTPPPGHPIIAGAQGISGIICIKRPCRTVPLGLSSRRQPASQAIGLEHLAAVRLGIAAHLLADRFLQSAVLSRPALAQLYRPISRGWHGFPKTTLG